MFRVNATLLALLALPLSARGDALACDKPELAREQVAEIALNEGKVRGVHMDGPTDIRITEHGCEYDVIVRRKPAGPGEYFYVIIGRDKQVVAFRRGL